MPRTNHRKRRKRDLHYLLSDGMIACNPRDKEASHRATVENMATEDQEAVTCKKCWVAIRKQKG